MITLCSKFIRFVFAFVSVQLPESQKNVNDVLDLIIEASHVSRQISLEDGSLQEQLVEDPKILYYSSRVVNSNMFGRFAFHLEDFFTKGEQAFANMCYLRAKELSRQITAKYMSYRYSIDAKGSESIRDKNNSQSTVMDKINRNKVEKVYTVKGDMKKSAWEGITGKDVGRDEDNG